MTRFPDTRGSLVASMRSPDLAGTRVGLLTGYATQRYGRNSQAAAA